MGFTNANDLHFMLVDILDNLMTLLYTACKFKGPDVLKDDRPWNMRFSFQT